ncbi:lytic murein transglycosylase [Mesorhizobium sp. BAC0120]|uniref:lytic murein transglycosylase n=1 Tax=Mesorhizobium sp. BAC0120 TaxID=3090670 RepID=UPI00298BF7FE|nr:lytic murein transglycosylase [Mesorhizobium sp. BAC0120]MDW6020815.1 lytic murein transglycosylase [Mesorhizobium sp. BAC0120]
MGLRAQAVAASFMLASAMPAHAVECGGDFSAWKKGFEAEAGEQGIGLKGQQALDQAGIDPNVLKRDRAQGVFTQSFIQFSSRMVNAYRLKQGAANLKKYADVFARAEAEYGVPPPVITAFWALETDFGAVQGDFKTLDALATLSHDCRRPELFRPQLMALLKLIDLGTVPPDVRGAWAGEIGQTQILPKDYLEKGVDGDGDGEVDLRGSPADVIMTTAKFVHSLGWRAGEPWLEEVRVPDELPWEQTGRNSRLPVSQWSAWGVTYRDGAPLKDKGVPGGIVLPMGRNGPAFLAYPNYDVYLEWNQSFVYTLTAAHLADRLAGSPPYDPRNPDPALSADEMKALQTLLQGRGYDVGKIDGVLGSGTREAVRQEQKRLGLPVDGWPTQELLARLSA